MTSRFQVQSILAPGRSMQIDDVQVFFMGMDCQNMNGLAMYMSTYILKYFKMV